MPLRNTTIYEALKRDMEDAYLLSLKNVEFRPLISKYTRDTGFNSFGVYARKSFKKGDFISGLVGFLVPIKEKEIIDGKNDVSVIRHHTGSTVMLGGFFCKFELPRNCCLCCKHKASTIETSGNFKHFSGISTGEEITVLYICFGCSRISAEPIYHSLVLWFYAGLVLYWVRLTNDLAEIISRSDVFKGL